MQSAKFWIGSAYDRLYKWVRATPFLNYSLFIIHCSLKEWVRATPFLNYSLFIIHCSLIIQFAVQKFLVEHKHNRRYEDKLENYPGHCIDECTRNKHFEGKAFKPQ